MTKTSLYRYYNADNVLLYVGVSNHPFSRVNQHGYNGRRMTEVAHIELEWFDSREIAFRAEFLAIGREGPIWNVSRPTPRMLAKTNMSAEVFNLAAPSKPKHRENPLMPNGAGPPSPWVKYALGNVQKTYDHKFPLKDWKSTLRLLRTGDILITESGWDQPDEISEASVRQWFYIVEDAA